MVYQGASSSRGATLSRTSFCTDGAISAMPISSGRLASSLCICLVSSIATRLAADNTAHRRAEEVIEETHEERDGHRDTDDNERVRPRGPIARPHDVGELFANMLQVGKWVHAVIRLKKPPRALNGESILRRLKRVNCR